MREALHAAGNGGQGGGEQDADGGGDLQRVVRLSCRTGTIRRSGGKPRGAVTQRQPHACDGEHLAQHHPDDARPLRAQRHADADSPVRRATV